MPVLDGRGRLERARCEAGKPARRFLAASSGPVIRVDLRRPQRISAPDVCRPSASLTRRGSERSESMSRDSFPTAKPAADGQRQRGAGGSGKTVERHLRRTRRSDPASVEVGERGTSAGRPGLTRDAPPMPPDVPPAGSSDAVLPEGKFETDGGPRRNCELRLWRSGAGRWQRRSDREQNQCDGDDQAFSS